VGEGAEVFEQVVRQPAAATSAAAAHDAAARDAAHHVPHVIRVLPVLVDRAATVPESGSNRRRRGRTAR
jgi:hypothetical protein